MRTWILVTAVLASVTLAQNAQALVCKSTDKLKTLTFQYGPDSSVTGVSYFDYYRKPFDFVVKEVVHSQTRVGEQTQYFIEDPQGHPAALIVSKTQVFVPGKCTRADCSGDVFQQRIHATLSYEGQFVSLACHESAQSVL